MHRILLVGFIIFLFIATLYRIFFYLTFPPLQRWDEQTNIQVITNSLSHQSFPVLYLDNKPFFEKPPLWYMTSAILSAITHQPLVSARLVSALWGIGIIFLTVFIAWKWWGLIAGFTAWIVLLTTNQLFVSNAGGYFSSHTFRSADIDSMQIFFMIIACIVCLRMRSNKFMPIAAGITTGLAILTKGPLGIIPLIIATILFAAQNKSSMQAFFKAWITTMVITIPWYLFMTINFGLPFLSTHFGYHIINRVLFPIEGHNPPPWYYFQLLGNHAVFFSWELLTISVIWTMVKKLYSDPKILYILAQTIIFFIIPTLIRTKLAWYLFPFYPFAALIIGVAMADIAKYVKKLLPLR